MRPPGVRAIVNGVPAPRLALLHDGDLISVEAGPLLTVELERTAPTFVSGGTCPACCDPLDDTQRVCTCPCGSAVHADPELGCVALVPSCSRCGEAFTEPEGEVAP